MKDGKILSFGGGGNICLFCGQPKKQHYQEYEAYWECDCADAEIKRQIEAKIEELKRQIPREKFEIREEQVLYKVKD